MSSSIEGRSEIRGLWVDNKAVRARVPDAAADKPNSRRNKASACSQLGVRSHRKANFWPPGLMKATRFARRVDPHLKPQLQHQERPKSRMMILHERTVLIEQLADIDRVEKASFSRALRKQRFVGEFLEFSAEPVIDGTAEPHFR